MNQRGVHSQGTTGGEDRVFNTKVSNRPTVARNRTRTQWRPRRPNGKGFVNIGPKFPFTVGEEGVVRRYLPGTMGPILVGKKGSTGQTRPPRRPWPAVMRSASRRGGRSRPPPPRSECSARPPPGPAPADTRPRGPSRLSGRRVGSGGGEPRAQIHKGGRECSGVLKNSIERQGFETWPSFEIWDATFLVRQKRTFCTRSPELF